MKNKFYNIILFLLSASSFVFACTGNCYEPVADPGENVNYFQGMEVSLDGSASYDPDNSETILTYLWSAPTGIQLIGSDTPTPTFIAPSFNDNSDYCSDDSYQSEDDCLFANEYWVTDSYMDLPINLIVNDGEYNSPVSQVYVRVVKYNTSPVLDIETTYQVNKETEVIIDASSANDDASLTGTLAFTWIIDENVEIYNELNSPILIFTTPDIGGSLDLELVLSDGIEADNDTINFDISIIENRPPVPIIDYIDNASILPDSDFSIGTVSEFTLSAARSYDPDTDEDQLEVLAYDWNIQDCLDKNFELIDGVLSSEQISLRSPDTVGLSCDISLTVTDGDGGVSNSWSGEGLFISEIVEASTANNTYIELFNGTNENIDLSNYSISIFPATGSTSEYVIDTDLDNKTINSGETFIIARSSVGAVFENIDLWCDDGVSETVEDCCLNFYDSDIDADNTFIVSSYNSSSQDCVISDIRPVGCYNGLQFIEGYSDEQSCIDALDEYGNSLEYDWFYQDIPGPGISGSVSYDWGSFGWEVPEYAYIIYSNLNKMGGDDALVLYENGIAIDVMGTPGVDPGQGWEVSGIEEATKNHTLVRKPFVIKGNTDWALSSGNIDSDLLLDDTNSDGVIDGFDSEWYVSSVNDYESGGFHPNTYCDNIISVSVTQNVEPKIKIESEQEGFTLLPGSILELTGLAVDEEGALSDDGSINRWNVAPESISEYLTLSEPDIDVSDGICVNDENQYANNDSDIDAWGCDKNLDCTDDEYDTCNEDDGVYEISENLTITISEDLPESEDYFSITFTAADGYNSPVNTTMEFDITRINTAPVIDFEIRETCPGNSVPTILSPSIDGSYEILENCTVQIDASASIDSLNSTGTLTYEWEELPFLDLDLDEENDFEVSSNFGGGYTSNETTDILTFITPNHISSDQSFSCELLISDGDLDSDIQEFNFIIISTSPIVSGVNTDSFYEYIDSETANGDFLDLQDGSGEFLPINEGMVIKLNSSAFDPNGADSGLSYTWSIEDGICISSDAVGSENYAFAGESCSIDADCPGGYECEDSGIGFTRFCDGDIDSPPCRSNADCSSSICLDMDFSESYSYITLPVNIGKDTDFQISLEAEDSSGAKSNEVDYIFTVFAQNPVSNAGYDFTAVSGTQVELSGYYSYDAQEEEVVLGSWNGGTWEESNKRIISNYYEGELIKFENYSFTWSQVGVCVNPNSEEKPYWNFSGDVNDVCESDADCGPTAGECAIDENSLFWYHADLANVNAVNPTFVSPNLSSDDSPDSIAVAFKLEVSDPDGNSSKSDFVGITITRDQDPQLISKCSNFEFLTEEECTIVQSGAYEGEASGLDWNGDFRAYPGNSDTTLNTIYLKNMSYKDNTPKGVYEFIWESVDNEVSIQNPNSDDASFTAWPVDFGVEDTLQFTYTLTNRSDDGSVTYSSQSHSLNVILANPSAPISPKIDAYPEDGQITLYWDSRSEDSIDSLTTYADFQGYRVYKSSDYGETWGDEEDMILSETGELLGWQPFLAVDYNEAQDEFYCLYKSGEQDCERVRGLEISGADIYQSWFSLGANTGLVQTFVDTNVINGIDYTYTITAFDRGLRPSTQSFGSYNDLDGEWEEEPDHNFSLEMPADYYAYHRLDYVINESFISNGVYMYSLDKLDEEYPNEYSVIYDKEDWPSTNPDGYYVGLNADDKKIGYSARESLMGSNVEDLNYIQVTPGHAASNVSFPSIYDIDSFLNQDCKAIGNSTKSYEIVNLDELVSSKIKFEIQAKRRNETFQGYASDDPCLYAYRVIPNPDLGDAQKLNYVPVSVTFNGNYNVIQPRDLLRDSLVNPSCSDYETVDACNSKYAYGCEFSLGLCVPSTEPPVVWYLDSNGNGSLDPLSELFILNEYVDIVIEDESLCSSLGGAWDEEELECEGGICSIDNDCSEYFYPYIYKMNQDGDIQNHLPGIEFDLNSNPPTALVPEYFEGVECFDLEYLDDPDYLNNFTPTMDGIRVRFDNLLRNFPSSSNARIYDAKSEPDASLINAVLTDVAAGGSINLQYYTSFSKKPSFDYVIELSDNYISPTVSPGLECPQEGEYQLPFRVKNLTTEKYVTLKHNDNGIFNGERPLWYIPPANDPEHDPGADDCMWQPGELVYFEQDSVLVGENDNLEFSPEKTYALNITYSVGQLLSRNDLCSSFDSFTDVGSYNEGDCVYDEGQIWYATRATSPVSDGYEPSGWYYDEDDEEYFNSNPWIPIYPWGENAGGASSITLETQKWFVDEDYWIADLAMLGVENEVRESDLDKINVVPNPYIVKSDYNKSPNSLRFTYLPSKCTIKIFTVSGELVDVLSHDNRFDGDHFWDLKNARGQSISPGLYIYVVEEDYTGLKKIGKFAVVR